MSEHRKVPTSRLGRFARLAAVGVRSGAGMLVGTDGGGAAQQAAEVLGTLRGLAAKIGQMASYVDGLVPEGQRDAYEGAMTMLRAQAPQSSPAEVKRTVEEELGAPIDRLFVEWDAQPMASASIGQVHRARLESGLEVAVKVQHAGIAAAVESDLANASILEGLSVALGARRFDMKRMLDVVRARFREELDYRLEATRIDEFRAVHAGDPHVRIPRVVHDRSAARVLTTELVRGATFDDACREDELRRRAWAETLWRFVFKGNLVGGTFNADPHPGNYVFQDEARIAFLDFGCCQVIHPEHLHHARRVHGAALEGDERAFRRNVADLLKSKPGRLEDAAVRYTRKCFEPLFRSPYRVTRPYAASLLDEMREMALVARKMPESEFFTMPPEMLFINRLQFGFYSVLARLDVEADYRGEERKFLPLVLSGLA